MSRKSDLDRGFGLFVAECEETLEGEGRKADKVGTIGRQRRRVIV